MKPQDLIDKLSEEQNNYESMPSIDAQEALDIVTKQLLGDNWTPNLIHTGQCNTEAVCEILKKYPSKQDKQTKHRCIIYNTALLLSWLYFMVMTVISSIYLSSSNITEILLFVVFVCCGEFISNNLKLCMKH